MCISACPQCYPPQLAELTEGLIFVFLSQGDFDPIKTRVLHFKMNPITVAKQQRQQDIDALREEVTRLSELVRSLQEGGAMIQGDSSINASLSLSLPPSKEVVGKINAPTDVCLTLIVYELLLTLYTPMYCYVCTSTVTLPMVRGGK